MPNIFVSMAAALELHELKNFVKNLIIMFSGLIWEWSKIVLLVSDLEIV